MTQNKQPKFRMRSKPVEPVRLTKRVQMPLDTGYSLAGLEETFPNISLKEIYFTSYLYYGEYREYCLYANVEESEEDYQARLKHYLENELPDYEAWLVANAEQIKQRKEEEETKKEQRLTKERKRLQKELEQVEKKLKLR